MKVIQSLPREPMPAARTPTLPIVCPYCRHTRLSWGRWVLVKHPPGTMISHQTCPSCVERLQPQPTPVAPDPFFDPAEPLIGG